MSYPVSAAFKQTSRCSVDISMPSIQRLNSSPSASAPPTTMIDSPTHSATLTARSHGVAKRHGTGHHCDRADSGSLATKAS
jgi:hypothetical protein